MSFFFYVDERRFQPLREATEGEKLWFIELAKELQPLHENVKRFNPVQDSFANLEQLLNDSQKNAAAFEKEAASLVQSFLYSFKECLDHWETYIKNSFGEDSDYLKRFKSLTALAFDSLDEYKITYALRNCQHTGPIIDGYSLQLGEPARLYANRTKLLERAHFSAPQREALKRLPERFELFPIFRIAKKALETIEKKLMFYSVTPDLEKRAIDALKFKEEICGTQGVLLLGDIFDNHGNRVPANDETMLQFIENQELFKLGYTEEIPWGECIMLRAWKGTDYKNQTILFEKT